MTACGKVGAAPAMPNRALYRYDDLAAAADVGPLLAEIDAEPNGVLRG